MITTFIHGFSTADSIALISLIIAGLSLLLAIIGILVALHIYKQQVVEIEPWSLSKVDGEENLWILERKKAKLAAIRGIVKHKIDSKYEIKWHTQNGEPHGYFTKGSNVLLRIESPIKGAIFQIYYEEYKKKSQWGAPEYQGKIPAGNVDEHHNLKLWESTLY